MEDLIGLISTIIGTLATIIGGARYLIGVYYKKEDEILKHRHDAIKKEIIDLREIVKTINSVSSKHADEINQLRISLEKNFLRYQAQSDSIKVVADDFKQFMRDTNKVVNSMQSQIIKVTETVSILKARR